MRISLWPALVCGSLFAATVGNAVLAAPPAAKPSRAVTQVDADDEADSDEESAAATEGSGGFTPYQPMQYVQGGGAPPDGGGFAPGDGGPGPMGFDPAMTAPNAWPGESPYTQYPRQETFNSGGLWQYNANEDSTVKRFFTTEYLYGYGLKPGNHYIGSIQNHAVDFQHDAPYGPFEQQTTSLFGNFFHNGTKASTGFENPDGSGLTVSGFILFESSLDNGLVSPHAINGQPGSLMAMWGITVDNPNGTGTSLPFDTRFFQKFNQNIYGADADFYAAPFFERETFKLKLLFGAKYLQIHEDFYVQGDDSGLNYTVSPGSLAIGGIVTPFLPPLTAVAPYSTVFQSSATSNLVGPSLGLRYDLGGDTFKIWGQSKIAVAANDEHLTVAGSNVQSYVVPVFNNAVATPLTNGPGVNAANAPSTRQQLTNIHISPIFDTSINVDFPGFAWIPYVNQWAVFKNANMRVGFNYVYVGDVARPANIINYNILTPTINATHTWFEYSAVNFAVNWKF
jgi:hypothetical protein